MKRLILLLMLVSVPVTGLLAGADTPPAPGDGHGDAGERLRTIMQRINAMIHDTGNVDTASDPIGQRDMADMVEAVEELLYYSELMALEPRQDVTEQRMVVFQALATQLYTEVLNVRQVVNNYGASTYEFNLLNDGYQRVYRNCAACHELFRDP